VKGEYFKLNDAVVQEHATFFAVCIPVSQVLEQGR
jgi:hypothetical protein